MRYQIGLFQVLHVKTITPEIQDLGGVRWYKPLLISLPPPTQQASTSGTLGAQGWVKPAPTIFLAHFFDAEGRA